MLIKMDLKETRWKALDWMSVAHNRNKWFNIPEDLGLI